MTDQFDIVYFNKIYDENKIEDVYDKGYGDWMEQNNNMIEQPKMFNKSFNKDLFNSEFSKYKAQQQKQLGTQVVQYDEPQVDISMKGKDSLMILGQNNISNFSGQSSGGLTFRDYKDAFTNFVFNRYRIYGFKCRDNNIQAVERTRSNVLYQMSERDIRRQQMEKLRMEKEEQDRINRLNQQDNVHCCI